MAGLDVALRLNLVDGVTGPARRIAEELRRLDGTADRVGQRGKAEDALSVGAPGRRRLPPATLPAEIDPGRRRQPPGAFPSGRQPPGMLPNDVARRAREAGMDADELARIGRSAIPAGLAFGALAGAAGGALTALSAFAAPAEIIRGLKEVEAQVTALERRYASVAVTAEMRSQEAIDRMRREDTEIGKPLGLGPEAILPIRQVYSGAGYSLDQQARLIGPSARAMVAMEASAEDIGQMVVAAVDNLKIGLDQIPAYLDMVAKGGKAGRFEAPDMAKFMPGLSAAYAGMGYTGLDAVSEIAALAQLVRQGTGSSDQAGTYLQDFLLKMTSPETVKRFADKGVDLRTVAADAKAAGESFATAMLREAEKLTASDPDFGIGELFGDQQVLIALKTLLANKNEVDGLLKEIRGNSAGTIDEDVRFKAQQTVPGRQARLDAVAAQGAAEWGKSAQGAVTLWKRLKAEVLNPGAVAQMERLDNMGRDERRGLSARVSALEAERMRLIGEMDELARPDPLTGFGPGFGGAVGLTELQEKLASVTADLRQAKSDLDTLKAAGEDVGQSPGEALIDGLQSAEAPARQAMLKIMETLEAIAASPIRPLVIPHLGASPTVPPGARVLDAPATEPAAPAAAPAPERHSALNQTNHFTITTGDPAAAAREVERRLARLGDSSGKLFDTA